MDKISFTCQCINSEVDWLCFIIWQSAHSDVNAGMNFDIDVEKNYLVKSKPTIVFAGISKTFVSFLVHVFFHLQ